ncbi:hypothetical protein H4R19_001282, partial [Coemansia spiralis]
MAKRQRDSQRERPAGVATDAANRFDYIYVGTRLPSAQEQSRREAKRRRGYPDDDKPKGYSRDAFKGGFSAGYFGTVGSKDGWQPATEFVSSRGSRRQVQQMRPEDFMDAEDLADLQAAQSISVNSAFAGTGRPEAATSHPLAGGAVAGYAGVVGSVAEVLEAELGGVRTNSDRIGHQIMASMGWKPGQGIGALSRDVGHPAGGGGALGAARPLLPPRSTPVSRAAPKLNWHGVGYGVDMSMLPVDADEPDDGPALPMFGALFKRKHTSAKPAIGTVPGRAKQKKTQVDKQRLSFGMAEDGGDDDDGSDGGSGSAYTGVIRAAPRGSIPPQSQLRRLALGAPALAPARQATEAAVRSQCHDGRPPLPGFTLFAPVEPTSYANAALSVPSTFTGLRKQPVSRWDAVPATGSESQLTARGAGSSGSSVPTLVTANDRARLGIMDAPRELPKQHKQRAAVDPEAAKAALAGFMPYSADAAKQARYRVYLERCAAGSNVETAVSADEATEFSHMARIFKPNVAMLSRFAAAGSSPDAGDSGGSTGTAPGKPHTKNVVRTVH